MEITFGYIDWMSQRVVISYENERDRWLQNRSAVRAARTRELLAGHSVDMAAAEAALGYRLVQRHLGIVVWTCTEAPGEDELSPLERLVISLGERVSCPALPSSFRATNPAPGRGYRSADVPASNRRSSGKPRATVVALWSP